MIRLFDLCVALVFPFVSCSSRVYQRCAFDLALALIKNECNLTTCFFDVDIPACLLSQLVFSFFSV